MGTQVNRFLSTKTEQHQNVTLQKIVQYNKEDPERRAPYGQPFLEQYSSTGSIDEQKLKSQMMNIRQKIRESLHPIFEQSHAVIDLNTTYASLGGYPVCTVPAGYDKKEKGLPLGLAMIGKPDADIDLLRVALTYEQATKPRKAPNLDNYHALLDSYHKQLDSVNKQMEDRMKAIDQIKLKYNQLFAENMDAPTQSINRLIHEALQGQRITIFVENESSKESEISWRYAMLSLLRGYLNDLNIDYDIIYEYHFYRKKIAPEKKKTWTDKLQNNNVIVIGSAKTIKSIVDEPANVVKAAENISFPWEKVMSTPNSSGAYIIQHPHNEKRLLLHYFYNPDHPQEKLQPSVYKDMTSVLDVSSPFYQFYVNNEKGERTSEKKVDGKQQSNQP